ncbi:LysM peptidoglycan-binding domain-containing protein [Candidatus Poribacteria bacterium]|nr:LysM peptidoglycan-binding domain-containing protein [Candidatus Poribacteria bacterium]
MHSISKIRCDKKLKLFTPPLFLLYIIIYGLTVFCPSFAKEAKTELSAKKHDKFNIHLLQKDETLSHVALRYYKDISMVGLLARYNDINDVRRIPEGKEIKVPYEISYTIKPNDSLSEIAQKLLGSWQKYSIIAEYNKLEDPGFVIAGRVLRIPLLKPDTEPPEPEAPPAEVVEEDKPEEPERKKVEKEYPVVTESEKEEKTKEIIEPTKETEEDVSTEPDVDIEKETKPETVVEPQEPVEVETETKVIPEISEEPPSPASTEELKQEKPKDHTAPIGPMPQSKFRLVRVKPDDKEEEIIQEEFGVEQEWPLASPWARKKLQPSEEEITEPDRLSAVLDALKTWDRPIEELEDSKKARFDEKGINLPMDSLLQVTGYKSITIQYNKTHYFGKSDINRYSGYYSGGYGSGFYDYDYGYDSYGYGSSYNSYSSGYSSYGSGYSSSRYGYGYGQREGPNIEQEFDIHIHGRVGKHTHVDVDYNDTGRSQYGGMGQKEQKISVWYEGDPEDIIQRAAFGDIRLELPNSRFLNMGRTLFGAQMVAKLGDLKLTAFGTRTKGIKGTWTSKGQSRRAGGGTGTRIMDINYIKERYYAINVDEDGFINDSYLPIETGSEQIYIDDGIGTNNDSGISTAQGYFDYQYPGDDYSIDYSTGQIEFLKNISTGFKIVVAYRYRGGDGGSVGNPDSVFVDDDDDGITDGLDDPDDPVGYVVIKDSAAHGSELRNVYSLGNRNIGRRNFELSIWREGATDSFETGDGKVAYIRIFGLDSDNDGLVDPELIDFERGILTFPNPKPFIIDDPASPYYQYRDELNNEAIYSENPNYSDQKYIIQADYSYQTPSFYLGRLNIIPESEEVRVNGQRLNRNTDYMMIYEVGSVEIFRELDEYDEITIDYEYMPFGGQYQQTIAGIWAEYSWKPGKKKEEKKKTHTDMYREDGASPFSQDTDSSDSDYSRYGSSSSSFGNYGSFGGSYNSYGSSYGSNYGSYGGYDSFSSYRGRRGSFGSSRSYGSSRSSFYTPRTGEGLNLSMGYVYNTGERTSAIPDVNSAPSRLQALVFGGNWGDKFNMARVFGLLPFVSIKGEVPFTVYLDGEAAYSRNNPNSVGYAMIDSMEGAKESAKMPTYKFSWKTASVPMDTESDNDISIDNRAIFHIEEYDEDASYGNYMKNRETSAIEINPLSRATQQHLVMEIGYDLNDAASWGALAYPVSNTGADFSEYEFLEIWMKVDGDENVNLHLDFGVISEDTDDDFRLDSEDLPRDMLDSNGDHKIDILDLDKEDLPEEHKYKGNGSLDLREDNGWVYNDFSGNVIDTIGRENSVLDSEDLDGDVVLDTNNSYFGFTIPLNNIPNDWIRKKTSKTGWIFLSIPLEEALPKGRSPSWAVIKHMRLWLEKNIPGSINGKFQWYSITVAGNRWEKGLVVENETGKLSEDLTNEILVGTKNNHEFEDYLEEYRKIEDNEDFDVLHPYVESAFGLESDQKEQSLTLNYDLQPDTTGYTMRELSGVRRGEGQDFSKHREMRIWLHGDGSGLPFLIRMGSNTDDFGAGSPITTKDDDNNDPYNNYNYTYSSYSSRYGAKGYYEYILPLDFKGWKLIKISFADKDDDGHPDELTPINDPAINNIHEILVGIKNEYQYPVTGEIWVNEIHLTDPFVKSGWARRFNLSADLANIFDIRAGYAKQDKNFENSAGQTGRSSMRSYGYSTSSYDYNVDTQFKLISWLPMSFGISHRESESSSLYGIISSYQSGLTKTDNKTFSISLDKSPIPRLSFSYDKQRQWNEVRGVELSDLYSSDVGYSLGSVLTINLDYSHEVLTTEQDSSEDDTTPTSSYYYYGRDTDTIVDRGGISLRISPIKSFSLDPSYEVRREMEREKDEDDIEGGFLISSRDQRISLRPTLRKFWGVKPSINGRYGFSEDWFGGEKDVSLNTDLGFGLNFTFKDWFKPKKGKDERGRDRLTELGKDIDLLTEEDLRSLSEEDIQELLDEKTQQERGNWIEKEKDEIKEKLRQRKLEEEMDIEPDAEGGNFAFRALKRSVSTFSINTDLRYSINDYLRRLDPTMGFSDIMKLEDESEFRTRSTKTRRFTIRANMDPMTWASLGTNMSLTNRFTKSSGTASDSDSSTVGGDIKIFSSQTSFMLKYNMTTQDSSNQSGKISDSISHNPSVTVRKSWSSGIGSSLGFRITFRDYERGGIETRSRIYAPNFNIDYDLHVKGDVDLPFVRKISLDHNLDMSNTVSVMVRREKLGINRDEKSEQYGTSLDVSYNLRQTLRASMRFSLDYNHDRVEKDADYISVSGSLMLRGEFR